MGCVVSVFFLGKKKEKKKEDYMFRIKKYSVKNNICIYLLLMKYMLCEKYLHENSQSTY